MGTVCRIGLFACLLGCTLFLASCDDSSLLSDLGLSTTPAQSHDVELSSHIQQAFPVATKKAEPLKAVARHTKILMPCEEVPVLFRVGGYIADMYMISFVSKDGVEQKLEAKPGDKVKKGDLLVQLCTGDYQDKVASARGVFTKALASRRQACLDLERYRALLDSKAVGQAEYDQVVERVDAVKAKEESARIRLAKAMEQLKDTALFAPMDGVITQKHVHVGDLVEAGALAYTVADFSNMKVRFVVPDWLVTQLHVGDVLPVDLPALAYVAQGTIVRVVPSSGAGHHSFTLEIAIDNADAALQEGMPASIIWHESGLDVDEAALYAFTQESAKNEEIPAIAMSAIVHLEGTSSDYAVYVVEKQHDTQSVERFYVRERQVTIGRVDGDNVELLTGVAVGDEIVVLGTSRLFDGAQVRILPQGQE